MPPGVVLWLTKLGFLNALVAQLWPNICVAGGKLIKDIAEPMFGTMLPAPLNTMRFKKIDLGKVPITFANVDIHRTENEGVKLDMDLDWDGTCDIELDAAKFPKIVSRLRSVVEVELTC
jgi:hypothetical protein